MKQWSQYKVCTKNQIKIAKQ